MPVAATGANAPLSEELDPKLGWLEAFVATARHLSYDSAGVELGIIPTRVKRNVESLEIWLHKVLILDYGPLELHQIDGKEFLAVATDVLEQVQAMTEPTGQVKPALTLRSPRSEIRLSALKTFVSLARHKNIKMVTFELDYSQDQVRRNLKKLEDVFGDQLLIGYSQLSLTEFGNRLLPAASNIVESICNSVAVIPEDYDPTESRLRIIRRHFLMRKAELQTIIRRADRKQKPTKLDALQVKSAKEQLVRMEEVLESIPNTASLSSGASALLEDRSKQASGKGNASDCE